MRWHLVTPDQEASDTLEDVLVNRLIGSLTRTVVEIQAPASQQSVQLSADFCPRCLISWTQDLANLVLDALHTLLRWARAQVPPAISRKVVRSKRISKKVEPLVPSVPDRGLCLVQRQPQPVHHLSRPRLGLFRMFAAENDEVIGIGDDMGSIGCVPSALSPVLQEAVHVEVGQHWANHSSHNGAKLPFDLTITIPRGRLPPHYRDGFPGAP